MIITKLKAFDDIVRLIDADPVFIVGCSECATVCHTGGEPEVLKMKQLLESKGMVVAGWRVLDPACNRLNSKRLLKQDSEVLSKTKTILVLACGNGVQTVSGLFDELDVLPGTDTLFLGEIQHVNEFEQRCQMCGECLLDVFGGVCPVTRCPKSMLNGPCGGVIDGKCEVNPSMECVWMVSIRLLKHKNRGNSIGVIQPAKDWSKGLEMKRCV